MKKFEIYPKQPKPFTLVFPHIPKTGGTTLLYHFRKNLGDNNILSYGQHNRVVRFFEGKHQLEELPEDEIQGLRIVQGHGVDQNIFSLLPKQDVKLLVILRNPVGLTKSRYNHQVNSFEKVGKSISTEEFLVQNSGNFMSKLLLDKFPMFVDPNADGELEEIISVLKKFDYVFTTEQLDQQCMGVLDELSVPHGLERRRVASAKRVFEQTDSEITNANDVDMAIFRIANQKLDSVGHHNPFGFDKEGRDLALRHIEQTGPNSEEKIEILYNRMASFMATNLKAESAMAKLEMGKNIALRDPQSFRDLLEIAWQKRSSRLTEKQAEISKEFLAKWKAESKRLL